MESYKSYIIINEPVKISMPINPDILTKYNFDSVIKKIEEQNGIL